MSRETEVGKKMKWASRSASLERMRAMIAVARPEVAMPHADLDANPWRFNCLNGTVDLRSGDLLPHSRQDYITKLSPVAYDLNAIAPAWSAFLDQIFDGNIRLQEYVQRFVGYSLTGIVSEQCLALLYGSGANGKSTFVNAVRYVLGEYGQEAAPELLLEKKFSTIPNDVARLRGARFVTVTETVDGRKFDEGGIKRLTGGDKITARFLRAEYFEFEPTHKFWISSNYKPVIRGIDYAIWRRIKMIPFEVTFRKDQQDPTLPAKLKEEAPGILLWAVKGCLDWQKYGLDEPPEVAEATNLYRTEMDVVQRFIDDCCTLGSSCFAKSSELFTAYKAWSEQHGEEWLADKAFGSRLSSKGFSRKHRNDGNVWVGLSLRR